MAQFSQYNVIYINRHRDERDYDPDWIIDHWRRCRQMELDGEKCVRYRSDVRQYTVDAHNQNEARAAAFPLLMADIAQETGRNFNLMFAHDWKVGRIEKLHACSGAVSKEDNEKLAAKMAHDVEVREVVRKAKRRRTHRANKKRTINGKPVDTSVRTSKIAS